MKNNGSRTRSSGAPTVPSPKSHEALPRLTQHGSARAPAAPTLGAVALMLSAALAACDLTVSASASIGVACSTVGDCPSGQLCLPPAATGLAGRTCQPMCAADNCQAGFDCRPIDNNGGARGCVHSSLDATFGGDVANDETGLHADATLGSADADAVGAVDSSDAGATIHEGGTEAGDANEADGGGALDSSDFLDVTDLPDVRHAPDVSEAPDVREVPDVSEPLDVRDAPDVSEAPDVHDADVKKTIAVCDGGGHAPTTLVLFGGTAGGGPLGDTWIWDGSSWSQRQSEAGVADASVNGRPLSRSQAAMSTACAFAVLTGGVGSSGKPIPSDAWLWNGTSWRSAPNAPPVRYQGAAATFASTLYLFGGLNPAGLIPASSALLAWNGVTWSPPPASPNAPSPRDLAAFTTAADGLLLFGGQDLNGNVLGDTWLFTGTTWRQPVGADGAASSLPEGGAAKGPSARIAAGAAIWKNTVVLFGGQDAMGNVLGDTWIWDGSTWSSVPTQENAPEPRWFTMMSALNGEVVLFGGLDSNFNDLGDTWVWSGAWTPGPSPGPSTPPARANGAITPY